MKAHCIALHTVLWFQFISSLVCSMMLTICTSTLSALSISVSTLMTIHYSTILYWTIGHYLLLDLVAVNALLKINIVLCINSSLYQFTTQIFILPYSIHT